ncbi:MAG: diaminopimelate decarboxylase [Planctomycetes bacterium GWF2_41_51]|nr:MAG: diaminopimelate decarboxylase [Planctomycetes bacterium GWF2_41_51]
MDFFQYKNGELYAEDVNVSKIAQSVGTPVYVYSKATILDHYRKIQKAFSALDTNICYSVKACGNINILKMLAEEGSGFDIVSGGELFRSQQTNVDMKKIVFAGVGKTDEEIIAALNAGIGYFNIESEAELENLIGLAKQTGKKTKAALRVNPDVDPKTHKHITTGKKESKFGVDIERAERVFAQYGKNENVSLCAIHVHLGSGGKTIDPYCEAITKVLPLIDSLRNKGFTVEMIDLGGGYGAAYQSDTVPSAADYAEGIVPLLKDKKLKLVLEPGKSIIANAGILLTKVLYLKQGGSKKFVIVDAGMNDLIRPCLYEAFHFIWPAKVAKEFSFLKRTDKLDIKDLEFVDVVGPICEGTDYFAKDRAIPPVKRGDLISIFTAGAYGYTMASNYNARRLPAEVLVDGSDFSVIRKRQSYEDLIALEK